MSDVSVTIDEADGDYHICSEAGASVDGDGKDDTQRAGDNADATGTAAAAEGSVS